jgi:hypothetical protein
MTLRAQRSALKATIKSFEQSELFAKRINKRTVGASDSLSRRTWLVSETRRDGYKALAIALESK